MMTFFYIILFFHVYRDGRLAEGDQILAIDGQVLEAAISHQAAISILQRARGVVDLVVARGANPELPSIAASLSSGSSSSNHQQKQQQQQQQLSPRQPSAPVQQLSPSLGSQSSRSSVGSGSVSASPRQPAITTTSSPSPLPATHHPVVEIISPDTASAAELLARSPSACSDSSKTGADMVVRTRSPFSLFRVEKRAYVQRQKKNSRLRMYSGYAAKK